MNKITISGYTGFINALKFISQSYNTIEEYDNAIIKLSIDSIRNTFTVISESGIHYTESIITSELDNADHLTSFIKMRTFIEAVQECNTDMISFYITEDELYVSAFYNELMDADELIFKFKQVKLLENNLISFNKSSITSTPINTLNIKMTGMYMVMQCISAFEKQLVNIKLSDGKLYFSNSSNGLEHIVILKDEFEVSSTQEFSFDISGSVLGLMAGCGALELVIDIYSNKVVVNRSEYNKYDFYIDITNQISLDTSKSIEGDYESILLDTQTLLVYHSILSNIYKGTDITDTLINIAHKSDVESSEDIELNGKMYKNALYTFDIVNENKDVQSRITTACFGNITSPLQINLKQLEYLTTNNHFDVINIKRYNGYYQIDYETPIIDRLIRIK